LPPVHPCESHERQTHSPRLINDFHHCEVAARVHRSNDTRRRRIFLAVKGANERLPAAIEQVRRGQNGSFADE